MDRDIAGVEAGDMRVGVDAYLGGRQAVGGELGRKSGALPRIASLPLSHLVGAGLGEPPRSVMARALPSSTLRALEANSREHLVSGRFSLAGEALTTMMHLQKG